MIRDHRPYFVKKLYLKLESWYVHHFLKPQFARLGHGHTFMKPWHVELFGAPVIFGNFANVIATPDRKIRLSVWSNEQEQGGIHVGNYCLICPGVRISSAAKVSIDDNCMLATNVYITDADWHDIYNRTSCGPAERVKIRNNVWIGDSAIICKGVTIGENSIIGAGGIVTKDIPPNVIAAGNPAQVIKKLDPAENITTRSHWFRNPQKLHRDIEIFDQLMLRPNSLWHWLRHMVAPKPGE